MEEQKEFVNLLSKLSDSKKRTVLDFLRFLAAEEEMKSIERQFLGLNDVPVTRDFRVLQGNKQV